MGWAQIIAAMMGLGGGLLMGGGGAGGSQDLTPDQRAQQKLMTQLLDGQTKDYQYGSGLRQHINDTADWLLPKRSLIPYATSLSGSGATPPLVPLPDKGGPDGNGRTPPPGTPPTGIAVPRPPGQEPGTSTPSDPGRTTKETVLGGLADMGGGPPTSINPETMQYMAQYLSKFGNRA